MRSRNNLAKLKNTNVPIVIFGAGENGEALGGFLLQNHIMPAAFCDNFRKGEKEIERVHIPLISFQILKEWYKEACILIGALFSAEQIKMELLNAGFAEDKVFYFTDVWSPLDQEYDKVPESALSFEDGVSAYDENVRQREKKRKVLMIAYYFPPLAGSGVYRSLKFAKYLPSLGWDTTVVSAAEPQKEWSYRDESLLKELPEEVKVLRIADILQNGTFSLFNVSRQKIENAVNFLRLFLDNEEKAFMDEFFKKPHQWIQIFSDQLIWAYEVCKILDKEKLLDSEIIYTTSEPYFSHLAGLFLHIKYKVPWVADFRDEWTNNSYRTYDIKKNPYHRLSFLLEKKIVSASDCVICVSDLMKENYVRQFGVQPASMKVITNGYDEKDFIEAFYPKQKNDKFTMVYTGLIYSRERNLQPLFQALTHLLEKNKIKREFMRLQIWGGITGPVDFIQQVEEYCLGDIIEQKGYVEHFKAIEGALGADLLICLVGDEPKLKGVYTGKIFDYLRCGKPILAIAPHGGVVDQLLQETGHGIAVTSNEIQRIETFLFATYQRWVQSKSNQYYENKNVNMYERKYLTHQLVDVFEEIRLKNRT